MVKISIPGWLVYRRHRSNARTPDSLKGAPEKRPHIPSPRTVRNTPQTDTPYYRTRRHTFTGAYHLKFPRKNLPQAAEEDVACTCGAIPEDTEHVLLHCPLTHEHASVTCLQTGCWTR